MTNVIEEVAILHYEIDKAAEPLLDSLGARIRCSTGCSECCVDEITVFQVEAMLIEREFPDVLLQTPHVTGACAFLDGDRNCRIYSARPYVCRTQGLPLRWTDQLDDGAWVEYRDICPVNEPGPAIEQLPAEQCFELGPFEIKLREIQMLLDGEGGRRMLLRSLFSKP